MRGFYLEAVASSVGSTLAFIIFRYFFANPFKGWSAGNKQWTALETVIVSSGSQTHIFIF